MLHKDVDTINFPSQNETIICNGLLRTHDNKTEKLFVEDLAALERLSDDTIYEEVKNRVKAGSSYTFIGDILLSLNPNKEFPIHDKKVIPVNYYFRQLLKTYIFSSTIATCSNPVRIMHRIFLPLPIVPIKT